MRFSILLVAVLSTFLTGCGEQARRENEQLRAANADLHRQINEQAGIREADLSFIEEQVSVARGCAWLVDICPREITLPGRLILQLEDQGQITLPSGSSGGTSWPFWRYFAAKLIAIALAMAALVLTMWRGYIWIIAPASTEAEQAQELVDTAERQREKIQQTAYALSRDIQALKKEQSAIEERSQEMASELEEIRQERDMAMAEAEEATSRAAEARETLALMDNIKL